MSLTRKSIPHIDPEKLSSRQKIELAQAIVHSDSLHLSLKVDGFSFRIGREIDGRPFVATARADRIYFPGTFSEYTQSLSNPTPEQIARSQHYDRLAEFVLDSDLVECIPPGVVQWCEMIYIPMCEVSCGKVKQVSLWYDQDKLGEVLTVVPFKTTNIGDPKEHIIKLFSSDQRIRVLEPDLGIIPSVFYKNFLEELGLPPLSKTEELVKLVQSRKTIDKIVNQVFLEAIGERLLWVSDSIVDHLRHPEAYSKMKSLGDTVEGIVVTCSNGQQFKIRGGCY